MSYRRAKWALCAFFIAVLGSPAAAQQANLPAEVWSAIAEMGPTLNQEVIRKSVALMEPLQAPRTGLSASQDVAYGPDPLQKMDLYQPQASAAGSAPIVIVVHGGGFTSGDKEIGENVAAYFARHGLLGVTINYRLAPTVQWPEQSLDLGSVVAWLRANAARYGGDPRRIVVIAHSSGGAVVISYLLDSSIKTDRDGVVGAVLLSGVFGYNFSSPAYYGDDPQKAAERQPHSHLNESKNESKLPLLIVAAEFDPPRVAAESHQFAAALCMRDSKCPPFLWLSGHNHSTEIRGIDTKDDRLGQQILEFVGTIAK
jgi:acetyl esterase